MTSRPITRAPRPFSRRTTPSVALAAVAPGRGPVVRRAVMLALVLAMGVSGATATAAVASVGPRVVPPVGRLYDDLSVAWWKYVLAQPKTANPLLDPTGAHCADAQSGDVFFLVGLSGSGTVTRDECLVPPHKRLFFPLLNAFDVHTPGDGLDTPTLVLKDFLGFEFRADSLRASVDGIPIGDLDPATTPYGACAGPLAGCAATFSLDFPADNLFGLPAGTYEPAVAAGYYLLLRPLRRGMHTITFGGEGNFSGATSQDITYHLRVGRPKP